MTNTNEKMFSYFFTECNVYAVDGKAYDASQKAGWMDFWMGAWK